MMGDVTEMLSEELGIVACISRPEAYIGPKSKFGNFSVEQFLDLIVV